MTKQQIQVRVVQSLELAIGCCDSMPKLPGFRRPPEMIPTAVLFEDFADESDISVYDEVVDGFPWVAVG